jgi:hypothetical protein
MRKSLSLFLAVITFWMSTWLITDIHDVASAAPDQPHPIFSAQTNHVAEDLQMGEDSDSPHCQVCSYDHGGHVGQALASAPIDIPLAEPQATLAAASVAGWLSHTPRPKHRPPIA